ncbi:MAG: hypothetical protein IT307_15185, partial [Chloroflexi bacterium]|nr:hypothetical protein [Chloroflexota bacterium]
AAGPGYVPVVVDPTGQTNGVQLAGPGVRAESERLPRWALAAAGGIVAVLLLGAVAWKTLTGSSPDPRPGPASATSTPLTGGMIQVPTPGAAQRAREAINEAKTAWKSGNFAGAQQKLEAARKDTTPDSDLFAELNALQYQVGVDHADKLINQGLVDKNSDPLNAAWEWLAFAQGAQIQDPKQREALQGFQKEVPLAEQWVVMEQNWPRDGAWNAGDERALGAAETMFTTAPDYTGRSQTGRVREKLYALLVQKLRITLKPGAPGGQALLTHAMQVKDGPWPEIEELLVQHYPTSTPVPTSTSVPVAQPTRPRPNPVIVTNTPEPAPEVTPSILPGTTETPPTQVPPGTILPAGSMTPAPAASPSDDPVVKPGPGTEASVDPTPTGPVPQPSAGLTPAPAPTVDALPSPAAPPPPPAKPQKPTPTQRKR